VNTKTIRITNVKEKEGKYGPSLQVGVKVGDEWENYYVNKRELFSYFEKGRTVTIEYEQKGGWNIIKGVAPESGGTAERGGDAHSKSIELQVLAKVCGELNVAGGKFMTPAEFAEWVVCTHALIFEPGKGKIEALKAEAEAALDAVEEEEDQIPF